MPKPKECPKCKAASDEINSAHEMSSLLGLNHADVKKWMCGRCGYFFDDNEATLESWYDKADFPKMKLSQIADVIMDDWRDIDPHAWPYVEAMMNLGDIDDRYGDDNAESIISYFLSNAKKWQGEVARAVKKHLKKLAKSSQANRNSGIR